MVVKQLHLFFVTCCSSVAATLAPEAFVLIKRGMVSSCPGQQLDHVQGLQLRPFGILLYQKNVQGGSIYQEEEEEYLGGSPESLS